MKIGLGFQAALEQLENELLTPEEITEEVEAVEGEEAVVEDTVVETGEETEVEVEADVEVSEDGEVEIAEVTVSETPAVTEDQVIEAVTELTEITESIEEIVEEDRVDEITEPALEAWGAVLSMYQRHFGVDASDAKNIVAKESFAGGVVTRKRNAAYVAESFRNLLTALKDKYGVVEVE